MTLALLSACASGGGGGVHGLAQDTPVKLGRPYQINGRTYVPTDDPTYDQIGEASWYGNAEQGRHTANGEIFYRQRPSAAHTTLPLPSYVEVTRLDTGRRILVRVNDRGPYARDRILDLSEEAAKELGIDRAGRAMVRVRRVTPNRRDQDQLRRGYPVVLSSVTPTATPPRTGRVAPSIAPTVQQPVRVAPPSAVAPAFATPGYQPGYAPEPMPSPPPTPMAQPRPVPATPYGRSDLAPIDRPSLSAGPSIIVASPSDPDAADALASSLAGEGARVVATGGGYRVMTGPYLDAAGAQAALARLRARGYQGAAVTNAPTSQERNGTSRP